jgi:hypothetical protein
MLANTTCSHPLVEAYFNDGRVVISSAVIGGAVGDNATGASIFHQEVQSSINGEGKLSKSGVVAQSANMWSVSSIWVTPEEVLATPPPRAAGLAPGAQ